jgi:Pyruvate/2-oxoacid:ferredoxin oxidoreductase delta subunit
VTALAKVASVAIAQTCTACGACIITCPEGALVPARLRPHVETARCTACLACIEVCPRDAITVVPVDDTVNETVNGTVNR